MKTFDIQNKRLQAKIIYDTPAPQPQNIHLNPRRTVISASGTTTSRSSLSVDGVQRNESKSTSYFDKKRLEAEQNHPLTLPHNQLDDDEKKLRLPVLQDLTPQFIRVSEGKKKPTLQEAYKSLSSHPYIQTKQQNQPSRTSQFRKYLGLVTASFGIVIMLSSGIVAFGSKMTNSTFNLSNFSSAKDQTVRNLEVAGVSEDRSVDMQKELYREWILAMNNGVYSDPDSDLDNDGLTNDEERKLGTNPTNANTCGGDKNDSEKLFYLQNPVTCKPINFEKTDEVALFNQVINVDKIKKEFVANLNNQQTTATQPETKIDDKNLLALFGVNALSDLDKINVSSVKDEAQDVSKKAELKAQYLSTINKIDKYVSQYRSYEPFDRNYLPPVHPAKYLETSLKYNVPLKYVIAVAQAESRFGTDRYTLNGNPTRISKNQNIYSIGLTDSPDIIDTSFPSWDDGVDAFGKWYKRFQDGGVSDCRKWKIFNPNGDYCAKITDIANVVDAALK